MPNFASVLKAAISRIARKEIRTQVESLKKAVASYRTDIATLKRRAAALEQGLKQVRRATPAPVAPTGEEATQRRRRFNAKALQTQRKRLGLSADDVGLLVGATGQSVYNWESGNATPRQKHLAALAALKTLGKKSAAAQVAALRQAI
jgi:DNA-binding transcriptional regulator YiaG